MLHSYSKTLLLSLATLSQLALGQVAEPKFKKLDGKIHITEAGRTFIDKIRGKEVAGTLRKIKSSKAKAWGVRIAELSDRDTVNNDPNFTPLNNLYNHMVLFDELIQSLTLAPSEPVNKLRMKDQIKEYDKQKFIEELDKYRAKLETDRKTLVAPGSQADFKTLTDYVDKALRETID